MVEDLKAETIVVEENGVNTHWEEDGQAVFLLGYFIFGGVAGGSWEQQCAACVRRGGSSPDMHATTVCGFTENPGLSNTWRY